jgi:hypothetical protein
VLPPGLHKGLSWKNLQLSYVPMALLHPQSMSQCFSRGRSAGLLVVPGVIAGLVLVLREKSSSSPQPQRI